MEKNCPPFLKSHWNLRSLHLKMDGWELSFGVSAYVQGRTVSFREGVDTPPTISGSRLGHRVQVLPVPRILQRRSQLGCTVSHTGESSSSPREKMFDDGGNPWFVGEPPRLIQLQQDWKETRKKHKQRRKMMISSHFSQGTSWFFFTRFKICIKPSHGSSWDKTTYHIRLGKKNFCSSRRVVGNQVVILRWDWHQERLTFWVPLWATISWGKMEPRKVGPEFSPSCQSWIMRPRIIKISQPRIWSTNGA